MKQKIFFIISVVLLLLYPFRHVFMGVDLWDGGYHYTNFTYSGPKYMDPMWYFATWGANILGNLLTKLPWGDTMAGMNMYTSLIVALIGLTAYLFCVRKLRIPAALAWAGEMLALMLCWAPTAALYNYLTYLFLLLGIMSLYKGLTEGKNEYLVLAGVILGWNVSIRFSNLVQAGLILAVWYYGFICKRKPKQVLQETGFCLLGYLGAILCFVGIISLKYGFPAYLEGISRLFDMAKQADDYTAGAMLTGMVWAYYDGAYWFKRVALAGGIAFLLCLLFPKRTAASRVLTGLKKGLTMLITVILMAWLLQKGFASRDFTTYYAVYYPCVLVFLLALGLAALQIFDKKADNSSKLQSILVVLLLLITPLGGNNAMYSAINNLFLVLPCFLWLAWRFVKERRPVLFFPFQTILVAAVLLLFLQGVRFGHTFIYEKATGGRDFGGKITEIPVLKGMRTSKESAEELEGLYGFLQQNGLQDKRCVLYGDIPGLSYYMGLAPAINSWGDLRSYGAEIMQGNLNAIALEGELGAGEFPLVILHTKYAGYYSQGDIKKLPEEESTARKLQLLCDFMEKHGYPRQPDYMSENYAVYVQK